MIRLSVMVPPPPGRSRRSGVLVFDMHEIELSGPGARPPPAEVRFDPSASSHGPPQPNNTLAQIKCKRMVIACSAVSKDSALALVSVGSLGDQTEKGLPPLIKIFKKNDGSEEDPEMTVSVEIPSVHVASSKVQWATMQYWIDDMTQALERINSATKQLSESRNSSIIGSRYFSRSQRESTFDSSKTSEAGIKLALLVNITECGCNAMIDLTTLY